MLNYVDTLIGFAGVMLLLSLLVTILVQGVLSLLNLRGLCLLEGVALVIQRAMPQIDEARGKKLAGKVLSHPTLSPLGRLANAVRLDELVLVLREVATKEGADLPELIDRATKGWDEVYASLPVDELAALFPDGDMKKAEQLLDRLEAKARAQLGDLGAWFDTVMDRTTERFVAWTRVVTIAISVVLAFSLHVDSLALLREISSNQEVRDRLVRSADAALKLADDVSAATTKGTTLASDALEAAARDKPEIKLEAPVAKDLGQRDQGIRWIRDNVKDVAARDAFQRAFEARYDERLKQRLPELMSLASQVESQAASTQLVLVPDVGAGWWGQERHLLGVVVTALLLTLGAPFWYNLLRQLASLRPLVAGKVDETGRQKAPSAASS